MAEYRWECECGGTGWMKPATRYGFPDTSLAGLVRQARSIHDCPNPDIVSVKTQEEIDQQERDSKRRPWRNCDDDIF